MDETPLYFNMLPNATIEKLGAKEVIMRTLGQEKNRFSVILTVLADGTKLPPYLIFKGKIN